MAIKLQERPEPSTEFCKKLAEDLSETSITHPDRNGSLIVHLLHDGEKYYRESRGIQYEGNTTTHVNNADEHVCKVIVGVDEDVSAEDVRDKILRNY